MTLALRSAALALTLLAPHAAVAEKPDEPLACDLHALNPTERDRHELLSQRLKSAAVGSREVANGYEVDLDLSRLPKDAHGAAFCVVEVAEWVELESRCCPFLDFAIAVRGKGGEVVLSLTGGANVKEFLRTELGLLEGVAK